MILEHALERSPPSEWQLDNDTARAVRATNRTWRDFADARLVREICLPDDGRSFGYISGFDIETLLRNRPSLFSSVRTARCSQDRAKRLTSPELHVVRSASNLRELCVSDLTGFALAHAWAPLALPNLSSLHFDCSIGIQNLTTRQRMREFLASLLSLNSLSMFFGRGDQPLSWFPLAQLLQELAPRVNDLRLLAAFVPVTVPDLTELLELFPNLHHLRLHDNFHLKCPRLLMALPNSLRQFSGIFNRGTLLGIVHDLANPVILPALRTLPDLQQYLPDGPRSSHEPFRDLPDGAVEQALEGLSRRGLANVNANAWRLWPLVPDRARDAPEEESGTDSEGLEDSYDEHGFTGQEDISDSEVDELDSNDGGNGDPPTP